MEEHGLFLSVSHLHAPRVRDARAPGIHTSCPEASRKSIGPLVFSLPVGMEEWASAQALFPFPMVSL